jgi:hypothetical protein
MGTPDSTHNTRTECPRTYTQYTLDFIRDHTAVESGYCCGCRALVRTRSRDLREWSGESSLPLTSLLGCTRGMVTPDPTHNTAQTARVPTHNSHLMSLEII